VEGEAMAPQPTVWLIDHDETTRSELTSLLVAEGFDVQAHRDPRQLLETCDPDHPGCFVLEFHPPEFDCLELRRALVEKGCTQPFLVTSGRIGLSHVVDAMREGAVDYLEKPLCGESFVKSVREAVRLDAAQSQEREADRAVQRRIDTLTPREREVMELVVAGRLTKQIAGQLGVSTKTVEVHRSNVTKKMGTDSVAQLVRLVIHNPPEDIKRGSVRKTRSDAQTNLPGTRRSGANSRH